MQLLHQPLTVRQLCRRADWSLGTGSQVLWELQIYGVVQCLTPGSNKSRVYWFTDPGLACRNQLFQDLGLACPAASLPAVPCELFGWLSFRHRQVVLECMTAVPEQVCTVRRRIRLHHPTARLSTNNCRDVVKAFEVKGIVERSYVVGRAHPRFRLTALGADLQRLLLSSRRHA